MDRSLPAPGSVREVPQDTRAAMPDRRTRVAACAGVLAYCWVAAGIRPFTLPMEVAVSLPTLAVATLATVPRGFPRKGSRPSIGAQLTWRGAGPWVVLIALLTAWEIVAYVGTSRADHPTLSSIFGRLLDDRPGRAALMVAWLVLGWALFVRRSKASSDRGGS